MTQYTPGPWELHDKEAQSYFCSEYTAIVRPRENGGHFAQIADVYGWRLPEGKANARLIAAAPEMYEALKWSCRNTYCKWHERECEDCPVGAALKKVDGDAS